MIGLSLILHCRLYYQYLPALLATCPLTVHALLHIADGFEACGPVWAYWASPMERYCARLQRAVLNSHRHLYVTLNKFAEDVMLMQIKMQYNLFDEVNFTDQKTEGKGHSVPNCKLSHILYYL